MIGRAARLYHIKIVTSETEYRNRRTKSEGEGNKIYNIFIQERFCAVPIISSIPLINL